MGRLRALTGGIDQAAIEAIRAHGGDVVVTFGGSQGPFLEDASVSPEALAGAYQAVIDAHALKAIDIDIESPSFYRRCCPFPRCRRAEDRPGQQSVPENLRDIGHCADRPGEAMTDLIRKLPAQGSM